MLRSSRCSERVMKQSIRYIATADHINLAWTEIGYFQIGDNPGRKEPTTGEINYKNIFKHVHAKAAEAKREFIWGMEHGNMFPGVEGEQKLIDAYVWSDSF